MLRSHRGTLPSKIPIECCVQTPNANKTGQDGSEDVSVIGEVEESETLQKIQQQSLDKVTSGRDK